VVIKPLAFFVFADATFKDVDLKMGRAWQVTVVPV